MARRSVRRSKPPKPKAPILTAEQKRRRIERLKKCIRDLQAFDPQKVKKRFGVRRGGYPHDTKTLRDGYLCPF